MQKLADALADQAVVINPLCAVATALCGIGVRQTWGDPRVSFWLLGVAVFVAVPTVSTKRNRLRQSRRSATECVRKALAACGSAYGHPERHVRVNIMLADKGRRRVDTATAFNMNSDPDHDLEIDAGAGVSGEAFVQRETYYGDLSLGLQPGGPTWGLRDTERAKVRRTLMSILSVPIFDPDHPDGALLGTLQVDSDLTIEQMQFDRPERRAIAERFADVIALLLKAGR